MLNVVKILLSINASQGHERALHLTQDAALPLQQHMPLNLLTNSIYNVDDLAALSGLK